MGPLLWPPGDGEVVLAAIQQRESWSALSTRQVPNLAKM